VIGRNASAADMPAGIAVGVLRGAYGVRGWLHVAPASPDADVLRAARTWRLIGGGGGGGAGRVVHVAAVRRHGGGLVAKLDGVDGPEQAEALRGMHVEVARSEFPPLPEGQYYWVDLIGARVVNRSGECLGSVVGLRSNGVHDVLEVAGDPPAPDANIGGGEGRGAAAGSPKVILVPLVADYVDRIDVAAGSAGTGPRVLHVDWERSWS